MLICFVVIYLIYIFTYLYLTKLDNFQSLFNPGLPHCFSKYLIIFKNLFTQTQFILLTYSFKITIFVAKSL